MKSTILKSTYLVALTVLVFTINMVSAQSKKKMNKDTENWKYEVEIVARGTDGSHQIKIWTHAKSLENALRQSKKNAVHALVFKDIPSKGRIKGTKKLLNASMDDKKTQFFDKFFTDEGEHQRFITLVNNGKLGPGDRIKIDRKTYKFGVVVSVNTSGLRKYLEKEGIIKGLSDMF